ncbi:MAG: hypothetical protein D6769_03135, partial [Methanobacteriota archaeon]
MHIESIDIHGFKSFKQAHIEFSKSLSAIAGPNGSGKSNIIDAILFVLGETSLSKIRADKLHNLINKKSNHASVTLTLKDGDEEYRLTRDVTKKGKGQAYIDGNPVTLKELRDFLIQHSLANSRSCIIPQGEILRIVKMKAKERKKYIDELADTLIYDLRRAEALKELETVGSRISETNLLLGEKLKLLRELKKEKEMAEKYKGLSDRLKAIKGTLIKRQLKQLRNSIESQEAQKSSLEKELEELVAREREIAEKLSSLEEKRAKLDEKLINVRERDELFQKAESMKSEVKIMEAEIESIVKRKAEIEEELSSLDKELDEKSEALIAMKMESGSEESIPEMEELSSLDKEVERIKRKVQELEDVVRAYEMDSQKLEALRSAG